MKNLKKEQKYCNGCKNWKNIKEFGYKIKKDNLLQYYCKKCQKIKDKERYNKNRKEILYKKKIYWRENKETLSKKGKEHYHKNKDWYKKLAYHYTSSPIKYNNLTKKLENIKKYEEVRESKNKNLECKCTYCGDWFEPTKIQLFNRINAIFGIQTSEGRLYCSKQCKNSCPIYYQSKRPKGYKPSTSREVQPELRQIVLKRDNYKCQKCSKHKDDLEVGLHCHHIYPLNENPIESADINTCITLCKNCHKEVHKIPGCNNYEMRCSE